MYVCVCVYIYTYTCLLCLLRNSIVSKLEIYLLMSVYIFLFMHVEVYKIPVRSIIAQKPSNQAAPHRKPLCTLMPNKTLKHQTLYVQRNFIDTRKAPKP